MECSRRRKVHSLIDKVYDPANLAEAWKRVRENRGSAGIDGLTVAGFEQRQDELLERLHKQLREKTYRPSPVKRVDRSSGVEREISAFHQSETGWFNRPWCRR
jgi:retron-type reverse transcriptase